ncbi:MAG TPA: hypothetical protein VJU82_16760 [Acidobacteriaceae bacterium]|nr:hypothetical protein [Acidobacteriaceae bacterium]
MALPEDINFDTLRPEEFERYLPDLFANGNGKVSQDPRLRRFLGEHPDCAALVSDLETIAAHARSLFQVAVDPSDKVWQNIQSKLQQPDFQDSEEVEPA